MTVARFECLRICLEICLIPVVSVWAAWHHLPRTPVLVKWFFDSCYHSLEFSELIGYCFRGKWCPSSASNAQNKDLLTLSQECLKGPGQVEKGIRKSGTSEWEAYGTRGVRHLCCKSVRTGESWRWHRYHTHTHTYPRVRMCLPKATALLYKNQCSLHHLCVICLSLGKMSPM